MHWVPSALSVEVNGRGVKFIPHLHLVQRLKMGGATHALPLYVFMSKKKKGKNLPLHLQYLDHREKKF